MDLSHEERDYAAGHSDRAPRLDEGQWGRMMEHIRGICRKAGEYGVRPVIHPHAGGYIEFTDEIEALVRDISYELAGLCLDTGEGAMCPIGRGCLDYPGIKKTLEEIRYSGYITVEQERDPRNSDTSLRDVKESVAYLKCVGYQI